MNGGKRGSKWNLRYGEGTEHFPPFASRRPCTEGSLFLKVDVGGGTVRVFGRSEELADRLEASGYDIRTNEIEAGMELHLPCLVKVG